MTSDQRKAGDSGAASTVSGTTPFAIVEAYAFNGARTGEQLTELRRAIAAHRTADTELRADLDATRSERDKFKQAFLEGSDKVVELRAELAQARARLAVQVLRAAVNALDAADATKDSEH